MDSERARLAPKRGYMPFVPNLAVEVVSPDDTYAEVVEKAQMWVSHGVALAWVADPRSQTVAIAAPGQGAVRRGASERLDGGTVRPGLSARWRRSSPD